MSAGTSIAAEVRAALIEAATATGEGPLNGVLTRDEGADLSAYPPTPGGTTTHPCTLILSSYAARDRDGTVVQVGDLKAIVAADGLAIVPDGGDRLTVGDKTYGVVSVRTVQPGGVPLYHELQVRG